MLQSIRAFIFLFLSLTFRLLHSIILPLIFVLLLGRKPITVFYNKNFNNVKKRTTVTDKYNSLILESGKNSVPMITFPPEILRADGGRFLCVRRQSTGLCTFFSTYHVGLDRLAEQILLALERYGDVSEITVCYFETVFDHNTHQYLITDFQNQITFTPQFFLP